ncbi:MAG: esterase/lipase family protein [Burkholderiales bacterium]
MKAPESKEAVLVVHGLWVSAWIMRFLSHRLRRCGYAATCFSYNSMHATLPQNATLLARAASALQAKTVHVVGHSLGGLVVLQMLEQDAARRIGRIVLMGVPCNGSYAAQALAHSSAGRWLLGRSMPAHAINMSVAGHHEIGVIAGNRGLGLGQLLISGLTRPNDGVVTVDETRLNGMNDHVVMRVSHSGMLFSSHAAREVCAFLSDGRFSHR